MPSDTDYILGGFNTLGRGLSDYAEKNRQLHPVVEKWYRKALGGEVPVGVAARAAQIEMQQGGAEQEPRMVNVPVGPEIQRRPLAPSIDEEAYLAAGQRARNAPPPTVSAFARTRVSPTGNTSVPGLGAMAAPPQPAPSLSQTDRPLTDKPFTAQDVDDIKGLSSAIAAQNRPHVDPFELEKLRQRGRMELEGEKAEGASSRQSQKDTAAAERQTTLLKHQAELAKLNRDLQWRMLLARLVELRQEVDKKGITSIEVAKILAAQRELSSMRSTAAKYRTSLNALAEQEGVAAEADEVEQGMAGWEQWLDGAVRQATAAPPMSTTKSTKTVTHPNAPTKAPAKPPVSSGPTASDLNALFGKK